ncbi:MAG TPA: hypothetical protein VMH28_05330 [Candidatus Acidoferrales bacterium]|nr:hypothetical protein [Candidatus Acidoferrales bacterium]
MTPATPTAAQICSVAGLGEQALALLQQDHAQQPYLAVLMENGLFKDAIKFLAYSLPKREAVWWAWVCARRAAGAAPAPKIKASLDATEKWIAQPTDENRRAAMAAAEAADEATAAGSAGLAAFFSTGSIAPPDVPPVPPGPYLTAKSVSTAVVVAALTGEPEKAAERFRAFVDQGVEVAKRIKLWERENR